MKLAFNGPVQGFFGGLARGALYTLFLALAIFVWLAVIFVLVSLGWNKAALVVLIVGLSAYLTYSLV